jgi:hypothetical protein
MQLNYTLKTINPAAKRNVPKRHARHQLLIEQFKNHPPAILVYVGPRQRTLLGIVVGLMWGSGNTLYWVLLLA